MTTKITNDNIVSVDASKVTNLADSFDDNDIVNDLSTLALRQASNENKAAYNTSSMYIDVFQDSTGITGLTDTERNASEYMSSVNAGDATDFGVTFSGAGSSGTNGLRYPAAAAMVLSGDFTIEWWQKTNTIQPASSCGVYGTTNEVAWTSSAFHIGYVNNNLVYGRSSPGNTATFPFAASGHDNDWHHLAFVRQGTRLYGFLDGVVDTNGALQYNDGTTLGNASYRVIIGSQEPGGSQNFIGTIDNFAISNTCKYPDATSFTPSLTKVNGSQFTHHFDASTPGHNAGSPDYRSINGAANIIGNVSTYGTVGGRLNVTSVNATGSFTSNNITASTAITSMGAVITYQDNGGTNALNTDIIMKLSADGGSNYATATLVAMPDFSSGIKMAKVNDLTVTSGTSLKYKIEFANQAAGAYVTGNRTSSITVSTNVTVHSGSGALDSTFVDGNLSNGWYFDGSTACAGKYIRFDWGSGNSNVFVEVQWTKDNTSPPSGSHGIWKWQGSNNASDWTDIGGTFELNDQSSGAVQTQTTLSGNTTAYRYYQLLGVSGTPSSNQTQADIQFKTPGKEARIRGVSLQY